VTKPIPAHHYTTETDTREVLEITLTLRNPQGHKVGPTYTLLATSNEGVVRTNLTNNGLPQSLSNLQVPTELRRKASPGWQVRVIEWAAEGLYTIDDID
jgi:hypothetical protein